MTQRPLGGIVGRLHACDFAEGPEMFAVLDQFLAEAARERIEIAAQQQGLDLATDRP